MPQQTLAVFHIFINLTSPVGKTMHPMVRSYINIISVTVAAMYLQDLGLEAFNMYARGVSGYLFCWHTYLPDESMLAAED